MTVRTVRTSAAALPSNPLNDFPGLRTVAKTRTVRQLQAKLYPSALTR